MRSSKSLTLVAGSTIALWVGLASAQCEQPWFEPRTLPKADVLGAADTDGAGLLEIITSDTDGLAYWTFDQGPVPVRTPILAGPLDAPLVADFDGDGERDDIAVFTDSRQMLRVLVHDAGVWSEAAAVAISGSRMQPMDHMGDGDIDLLVTDADGEGHVLSNPGDGSLTDLGLFVFGGIEAIWAGNLNADTRTDLILAHGSLPEDIAVYMQQPNGTFIPGPQPGERPHALADINGDGLDDMLRATGSSLDARLALGDGSFAAPVTLIDSEFTLVHAEDFDADGDIDVMGNDGDSNTAVYRNLGAGIFEAVGQELPRLGQASTTADVDGDGAPDMLTGLGLAGSFPVVVRGNGDCSFHVPGALRLPYEFEARRMTVGDLDNDGDADAVVLVAEFGIDAGVAICRNNGIGGFSLVRIEMGADGARGYEAPVLADFDADGDLDIAFWVYDLIVLLENTPDGQFSVRREFGAVQTLLGVQLLSADLTGNGLPDLLYPPILVGEHATLLRNLGAWSFAAEPLDTDPYPLPRALLDLTGDGVVDIVATNPNIADGELGVLPGAGDGTFGAPVASDLEERDSAWFYPGDFNGDGEIDMLSVAVTVSRSINLLAGDGTGAFADLGEVASYGAPRGIGVADLNADGLDDFIAGPQSSSRDPLGLHLSNGDGTFAEPIPLPMDTALTAAPVQLNSEGGTDILVAHNRYSNGGATLTTLLNQCGPFPCPVDLNHDGRIDTQDFIRYLNLWAQDLNLADWNHDGTINTADFIAFLNDWATGC